METIVELQNKRALTPRSTSLRELTMDEVQAVSGGEITSNQAGGVLVGFGASIAAGAIIGAIGGPGGMLAGAILGGARAGFGYGFSALAYGAYAA